MCGRFTLRTPTPVLIEQFGLGEIPELPPRYNIAPTQSVAAVRHNAAADRELVPLRWGLIPRWAKDPAVGNRMINARSETVAEKPSFRSAFRRRRCLIPADGFYEWRKIGGRKQPYYIHMADQQPFAFAGLWEHWESGAEQIESCTILTTEANALMSGLHDRMPVILAPGDFDTWLNCEQRDWQHLTPLLASYPSDQMHYHPVSTVVNSPRNQGPELVAPVEQHDPDQDGPDDAPL